MGDTGNADERIGSLQLPEVCEELQTAWDVWLQFCESQGSDMVRLMPVSGSFSIEVFSGCCVMTLGIVMSAVPALKPWGHSVWRTVRCPTARLGSVCFG